MLKEKAICMICYQSCKYTGGISNLILHVEHNHGINLKNDSDTKPVRTISSVFGTKINEN